MRDGAAAVFGLAAFLCAMAGMVIPASAQMFIPGTFEVSDTGAAVYTIPIEMPPGTAGMQPSLSLQYNSQAGDGLLGVGWSVTGLPVVTRCPETMAQDGVRAAVGYNNNDRFCLEGQQLIAISGTYGADGTKYRTEVDGLSRIISHGQAGCCGPAWFEVWTKAGQHMEFGNTADSQITVQGRELARAWAVNEVNDTKGNYFTVTYIQDTANGQYYPSQIFYGGNTTTGVNPYASVVFGYQPRPDPMNIFQAGSMIQTVQRLTSIATTKGGSFVLTYVLNYGTSPTTGRSRLTTLTECAGGSCLPAINLTWTDTNNSFATAGRGTLDATPRSDPWKGTTADINGDGQADQVAIDCCADGLKVMVALSNGNGTFAAPISSTLDPTFRSDPWVGTVADVNGDGKADIVAIDCCADGWKVMVALSNGDGTSGAPSFSTLDPTSRSDPWAGTMADVNGDGRADEVAIDCCADGWKVMVALSNGDGTFGTPTSSTLDPTLRSDPWAGTVADIDGDGRADQVAIDCCANGWNVMVALSNGNGTFGAPSFSALDSTPRSDPWKGTVADVNGDGKLDQVAIDCCADGWNVMVALSNGYGTFSAPTSSTLDPTPRSDPWVGTMADINGDGKADAVAIDCCANQWALMTAVSNGNGWFGASNFSLLDATQRSDPWSGTMADVNGDGKADPVAIDCCAFGWNANAALSNVTPNDVVATVANGVSGSTTLTYGALSQPGAPYTKDTGSLSCSYPCLDLQSPLYVTTQVSTPNGAGGSYVSNYSYAGAKSDLSGRGFLGFRQMVATDVQTGIATVTNYQQLFPYTGLVASRTKALGSQTLNSTTNTYGCVIESTGSTSCLPSAPGSVYDVTLQQSVEQSWDLNGAALPSVTTSNQYDSYGNATQVGVSTSDGYTKTTTNAYTNDTTNWFLGRLTGSSVTSTTPQ